MSERLGDTFGMTEYAGHKQPVFHRNYRSSENYLTISIESQVAQVGYHTKNVYLRKVGIYLQAG